MVERRTQAGGPCKDSAEGCPASQGPPWSYGIVCGEVTEMQTPSILDQQSAESVAENLQILKADCGMSCRYFIEGLCSVPTSITCESQTSPFSAPADRILCLFYCRYDGLH